MSESPKTLQKPRELDWGEWLVILVLIVVGVGIVVRGVAALDLLGTLFGLALSLAPILGTPQLRFYLKLTINYVSRGKFFHVEQSNVQAENIVNIQGDSANVQIGGKKADYSPNELVERVYTPLLNEANAWSDPGRTTGVTWSDLQLKFPYLTKFVHDDIASLFKRAEGLQRRIGTLGLAMPQIYDFANQVARQKLGLFVPLAPNFQMNFRIILDSGAMQPVWIATPWTYGMTLRQYAQHWVEHNYPGSEFELDIVIDSRKVGTTKTAIQFDETAQAWLKEDPKALEIQRKYAELRDLGIQAESRINEELDKLVRLKA